MQSADAAGGGSAAGKEEGRRASSGSESLACFHASPASSPSPSPAAAILGLDCAARRREEVGEGGGMAGLPSHGPWAGPSSDAMA